MDSLVSICIPVFNGEKHLKQCLDSAISQTYKNTEIIIIDDGSTDGSHEIITQYALKDKRIKTFFNTSNSGLTENWNKCIESASGEWIKFLFQDDYFSPECIEKMADACENIVPLVVCKRTFILKENASDETKDYYKNKVLTFEKFGITERKKLLSPEEISNFSCKNIGMNFIGEPTSILFKKTIVHEMGKFNTDLQQICDLEFALRIGSNYGLIYLNEPLTFFRIHDSSATAKNLDRNNYILSFLEPVLLARQMLFDPHFTNLRSRLALLNKIKLSYFFSVRAYEAFSEASKNKGFLESYNNAASRFTEIIKFQNPGITTRLILFAVRLRRQTRKIFY